MHGCSWVYSRPRPPDMKNFARLVRYALPYKVRFGLSICCAAIWPLLFFTELGAVYPLLHILFDRQNPQRWIAEKIDSIQDDLRVLEAARRRPSGSRRSHGLGNASSRGWTRFQGLKEEVLVQERALREQDPARRRPVREPRRPGPGGPSRRNPPRLSPGGGARTNWPHCSTLLSKDDRASIDRRLADIHQEIRSQAPWLRGYTLAQPSINRYLPADPFKCLLLLIAMVMLGVAFKGLFLFLQEVLVADVMQLTLLRIRNRFFRRTVNLDLASFSDQGSSELMAREPRMTWTRSARA